MTKKHLVITALFLSALMVILSAPAPAAPEVWARIMEKQGTVTIDGLRAYKGSTARIDSEIRTGRDARAIIKLRDGSVIQLRQNSAFVVRKYEEASFLDLVAGRMLAIFTEGEHQVNTTTTVAGVRGTGLYFMADDPERTYICLCYGVVDLTSTKDESVKRTLTADHHAAVRVDDKDGSATITKAGMEDHTDEEVERLKAMLDDPFQWWKWWK